MDRGFAKQPDGQISCLVLVLASRGKLLRRPMRGLRGLGWRGFETMPGRLDLGFSCPMASRPHLGGRRREFGDVKSDNGTGGAVNESGVLGGFRARSQPKANGNNTPPA
jgi:hypothetical protein